MVDFEPPGLKSGALEGRFGMGGKLLLGAEQVG